MLSFLAEIDLSQSVIQMEGEVFTSEEIHQVGLFCFQRPIDRQQCGVDAFHVPINEEGECVAIL